VSPAGGAEPNHASTAQELAEEGYQKTAAGEYAQAVGAYVKAYELSKAGAILFNIATIYDRKLQERSLAMEYFRRYLQAPDADPEFVQKATQRLRELKAAADEEEKSRAALPVAPVPDTARVPPVTPSPPAADSSPAGSSGGSTWRIAGVVVGSTGIVAVGTSLVLGALAKDSISKANAGGCGDRTCDNQHAYDLEQQAGSLASASTVTFVVGAGLLATGLTFYLLAPSSSRAPSASVAVSPQIGPSAAALRVGVLF
jgi:hypothetical protein